MLRDAERLAGDDISIADIVVASQFRALPGETETIEIISGLLRIAEVGGSG